jgi:hypothetical protein
MKRRSKAVEGCVNFPIDNDSTNEGGMLVKLWVIDRQAFDDAYGVCCGVSVFDHASETFLGTDKEGYPDDSYVWTGDLTPEGFTKAHDQSIAEQKAWLEKFFTGEHHEASVPLLAAIVMGSTGWSGDFICRYDDLNEDGKSIYNSMQKLYPKAELHLMTFLDT